MMRSGVTFLVSLVLAGSAAGQTRFEPRPSVSRQAIARGQGGEFIAAMEAMGAEADAKER